jgi:hypothetical protein
MCQQVFSVPSKAGAKKGDALEIVDLVEELRKKGGEGVCRPRSSIGVGKGVGAYLYVGATTLLGLPVTQCGHAEVHAPYLSLSIKKKDHQSARHPFKAAVEPTVLSGYPPEALDMCQRYRFTGCLLRKLTGCVR